jgi:hypothetical protein
LLGSGLKEVAAADIKPVYPQGSDFTLEVAAVKNNGDSAITLGLVPHGVLTTPIPVYFNISYKTDNGEQKTLVTPPVLFETFDSTSIKIVRKTSKDAHGVTHDEIDFSPQLDQAVVERYLRGPATRPVLIPVPFGGLPPLPPEAERRPGH